MSENNMFDSTNENTGEIPAINENISNNTYNTSNDSEANNVASHQTIHDNRSAYSDDINNSPKAPTLNGDYYTPHSSGYNGQYTPNYSNSVYTPHSGQHNGTNANSYYTPYSSQGYNSNMSSGASYTFSNDPSFGANNLNHEHVQKKKKNNAALKIVAIILSCVFLAGATGIGGAMLTYKMFANNDFNNSNSTQNDQQQNTPGSDESTQPSEERAPVSINKVEGSTVEGTTLTDVIAKVRHSVVEIVTENIQESMFYGQYVTSGAGSGVIINENGYIITNNHVVDGANNIYVRTTDEQEYQAVLVGKDAESDVAVIKINATNLSAATLGDSSAIKLGEDVIAIGNPLGSLGGTVTNGIISALDREVTIDGQKMVLLQTNAAVNPGNSGGGLFNMAGELIGVVNAKSSSSSSGATIEGLGFAIPVNHAFDVASQLIEFGYVKGKVSLGISVYSYERDMVYKQGFSYYTIKAGVYVDDPGKNTELKKDDRFISIDGKTVTTSNDIKTIISELKVGDTIKAVVARTQDNKETQVEVTLTCFEYVPTNN